MKSSAWITALCLAGLIASILHSHWRSPVAASLWHALHADLRGQTEVARWAYAKNLRFDQAGRIRQRLMNLWLSGANYDPSRTIELYQSSNPAFQASCFAKLLAAQAHLQLADFHQSLALLMSCDGLEVSRLKMQLYYLAANETHHKTMHRIYRQYPHDAGVSLIWLQHLWREGDYSSARAILDKVIELNFDKPVVHKLAAQLLVRLGELDSSGQYRRDFRLTDRNHTAGDDGLIPSNQTPFLASFAQLKCNAVAVPIVDTLSCLRQIQKIVRAKPDDAYTLKVALVNNPRFSWLRQRMAQQFPRYALHYLAQAYRDDRYNGELVQQYAQTLLQSGHMTFARRVLQQFPFPHQKIDALKLRWQRR